MAASLTDKLKKVGTAGTLTNMTAPGKALGASSFNIGSGSNYPTDTAFIVAVRVVDSAGAEVSNTYTEWIATISGTTLTINPVPVTGSDQVYAAGTTTQVYIPVSAKRDNDLIDALLLSLGQDGKGRSDFSVGGRTVTNFAPPGIILPYGGAAAPTDWLLCDGSAVSRSTYAALFAVISTAFGAGDGSTTFNLPDMRGRMAAGAGANTWAATVANTAVTTATDQITVSASPEWITGRSVVLTTSGGAPAGLTAGNTYYVIVVDSTHIMLASSLANAIAGTQIDITTQGTGNHTLTHTGTSRTLAEHGGEGDHGLTIAEIPNHKHTVNVSGVGGSTIPIANGGAVGATNDTTAVGGSGTHNNMPPYVALNHIIKT